ncbi:F0F1 ATP synthase subunit A [Chengkuizengella sediminis]|uniref:F0F1 ATP synthase subunit A n=1 Tax=Chengkuizengella sediminis TaxID=1885917 RepID=UPI00138A35CE|nr:F0F1 ATP synthase subunit A [Chengkuizengella sediminis]NDI36843.1 F0F1 ATP synthase subunit A [Chengkuizengella sediminis]
MHESPMIELFGIPFDLSNLIMITITCLIVFLIAVLGTRKLSVENPGKMQNFLEWVVEFIHNMISSTMDMKQGKSFIMLGITLIMYIFVANMLGLPFALSFHFHEAPTFFGIPISPDLYAQAAHADDVSLLFWKSPTASMSATMGLALIIIVMVHYLGITRNTKNYFKHYIDPVPAFFPLHVIEKVSQFLTLGLRLFGNIYAGEVLIGVILMTASAGVLAGIGGMIPLIAWQAFSIFVGSIQAFVFTILTMVYISQSIAKDH